MKKADYNYFSSLTYFSILGLDGSSSNSLGPPGTLWDPPGGSWDPPGGSQGVPEEELKLEFNGKVARNNGPSRGTVSEIFAKNLLKMPGWVKISPLENTKIAKNAVSPIHMS